MLCLCKKNWEFINRFSNSDPSPCAVGFLVLTLRLWIPHIRSMTRRPAAEAPLHIFFGGEKLELLGNIGEPVGNQPWPLEVSHSRLISSFFL
jgi:hypothetical protein